MKTLVQLLLVIALFTFASTASALTLTQAGGCDEMLTYTTLPKSDPENVVGFVNEYLDTSYTEYDLIRDDDGPTNWKRVEGTSTYFVYDFGTNVPDYFVVKIGKGGGTVLGAEFLYSNYNGYGVINLLDFVAVGTNLPNNVDIERISHTDTVGGAPVPEPSTLLLLGAGIAGLAVYRRKKN